MTKVTSLVIFIFFCAVNSFAQLNGNYTVGGTSPDFGSLGEACDSIVSQGINGPVVMNVRDGVYSDSLYLTTYSGASSTNTITFQSESLDANAVSISNDNNHTVYLFGDSIDFVTIQHLTFTVNSGNNAIRVEDGPSDITIQECILNGENTNSTASSRSTIYSIDDGNYGVNNLHILNNDINRGSYGVYVNWDDDIFNDVLVANNTIDDFYNQGVAISETSEARILYNVITSDTTTGNADGIIVDESFDTTIINGNQVYLKNSNGDGLDLDYIGGYCLVSNNIVSIPGSSADGIYVDYIAANIKFYNNTVVVGGSVIDGYFDVETEFINNVFISLNGGNIYDFSYNNLTVMPITKNNALYTTGDIAYIDWPFDLDYVTLSDWQTQTGNGDGSFLLFDPMFAVDTFDLHTCSDSLIGTGYPLTEVLQDVDGQLRSVSIPSIGADYFSTSAVAFLGDDFGICDGTSSVQLNAGDAISYLWSNGDTTATTTIDAIGVYTVEVTNTCGTAIDTVEVTDISPIASFTSAQSFFTFVFTNDSQNETDYLWDFGDGTTSTEENPTHIYTLDNTYTVTLTVTNECGTDTFTQDVTTSYVGMDELSAINFNLFPNPTTESATIMLDEAVAQNASISIVDLSGRTIKSIESNGATTLTFDLSDQPNGAFIVRVATENGVANKRLIKL